MPGVSVPESLGGNRLGEHRALRDLDREDPVKQLLAAWAGLLLHDLDRALGGVGGDAGEAPGQFPGAEPVVAVPVGGVDVGQPPTGPLDPVTDALDLRAGEGRVHQKGVVRPKISVDDSGDNASGGPSGMRSSPAPAGPSDTKTS
jgi:hypothetical protein